MRIVLALALRSYESVSSVLLTRRGEEVSLLVAATTMLKSLFRKIAAPKTLHPAATPSAVRGIILSSVVERKASRSWAEVLDMLIAERMR